MKRLITSALLALSTTAHADEREIDVDALPYLDVVETSDGSVWKGVLVEQTPNVQYKIAIAGGSVHVIKAADVVKLTKVANRAYRAASPTAAAPTTTGVVASYDRPPSLPKPEVQSGTRIEPELAFVFPSGVLGDAQFPTAVAPGVRVGREQLWGNFGLTGGGHMRFVSWSLPGPDTKDAMWTLETHLYGRTALHIGPATMYLGLTLGLDTNYVHAVMGTKSATNTTVGVGVNLQTGISIVATPVLSLELGGDYHPGTDTISDLAATPTSVSYWGLRIGTTIRL